MERLPKTRAVQIAGNWPKPIDRPNGKPNSLGRLEGVAQAKSIEEKHEVQLRVGYMGFSLLTRHSPYPIDCL